MVGGNLAASRTPTTCLKRSPKKCGPFAFRNQGMCHSSPSLSSSTRCPRISLATFVVDILIERSSTGPPSLLSWASHEKTGPRLLSPTQQKTMMRFSFTWTTRLIMSLNHGQRRAEANLLSPGITYRLSSGSVHGGRPQTTQNTSTSRSIRISIAPTVRDSSPTVRDRSFTTL